MREDLIERLIDEADGYGDGPVVVHDIEGLRALLREAAAALRAVREAPVVVIEYDEGDDQPEVVEWNESVSTLNHVRVALVPVPHDSEVVR